MDNFKLIIIYWIFIIIYSIKLNNFLLTLISIELLIINTVCLILMWTINIKIEFYIIYFLVIIVTERVIGLSLLIIITRIYNNDSTNIINLQW